VQLLQQPAVQRMDEASRKVDGSGTPVRMFGATAMITTILAFVAGYLFGRYQPAVIDKIREWAEKA
jgi:hypothetical protein